MPKRRATPAQHRADYLVALARRLQREIDALPCYAFCRRDRLRAERRSVVQARDFAILVALDEMLA